MYQEKNDRQLLDLVSIHKKLTYRAQLNLKDEISKRNLNYDLSELNESLNSKKSKINNLDYLKNMGFELHDNGDSVEVKRTSNAVWMDIVAIVVGLLFIIISINGIVTLFGSLYSDQSFSIFTILWCIAQASLGILGFQFLSGINRLIDHSGFQLLGLDQMITLRKRLDLKKIEIQKEPSSIHISNSEKKVTLQMEEVDIISTYSDNYIHKMTLKKLKEKLHEVS